MDEIKKGDTVTLKSGGPTMTVNGIKDGKDGKSAACVWFDGSTPKRKNFDLVTLEKHVTGR
jgi:uncharacterized protein YodC (DUF2158 family)